ncbi:hypothetical protein [Luteibacter aegosomatissinici]|uniref:hypothetical protein n=1 Tax=Luteibacter aegosomatissinici TaxID=2911539 RepID=UPI001FFC2495|nr:hypothetical protein [Luteibacter aegosomatissinici]UPG92862.1 hypothetical protein L2Y97_13405 [Luteibacter aegosomatissinici]
MVDETVKMRPLPAGDGIPHMTAQLVATWREEMSEAHGPRPPPDGDGRDGNGPYGFAKGLRQSCPCPLEPSLDGISEHTVVKPAGHDLASHNHRDVRMEATAPEAVDFVQQVKAECLTGSLVTDKPPVPFAVRIDTGSLQYPSAVPKILRERLFGRCHGRLL